MEETFSKLVDFCPACNSPERFFGNILEELKQQNLLPDNVSNFDFQVREGIPLPPQKLQVMPIGATLPFFKVVWDICEVCGCMYAVSSVRAKVTKSLAPPEIHLPGHSIQRPQN